MHLFGSYNKTCQFSIIQLARTFECVFIVHSPLNGFSKYWFLQVVRSLFLIFWFQGTFYATFSFKVLVLLTFLYLKSILIIFKDHFCIDSSVFITVSIYLFKVITITSDKCSADCFFDANLILWASECLLRYLYCVLFVKASIIYVVYTFLLIFLL